MNGSPARRTDIPLWPLAMAGALLPLATIHVTYLIAAAEGYVEWCIPHWDNCTSISRTGRQGTAYFVFKGAMLPTALLWVTMWWLARDWLAGLGAAMRHARALPWVGLIAGLALAGYTLALGHEGEGFRLMRRTGVVFAFGLGYLAQFLISAALLHSPLAAWGRRLLALCALILAAGLLTVFLDLLFPTYWKTVDDAFEWSLAVLVMSHAAIVAWLWRQSGFGARLHTDGPAG
jgi:hypothetical protein